VSRLESIFWHILGYGTMPFIFVVGFIAVAVTALWLLSLGPDRNNDAD